MPVYKKEYDYSPEIHERIMDLDRNVPREMIEQIIDAGRMSPSAKNRQPWKYIVLGGENKAEFLECMSKGIMKVTGVAKRRNLQSCVDDCKAGIARLKIF